MEKRYEKLPYFVESFLSFDFRYEEVTVSNTTNHGFFDAKCSTTTKKPSIDDSKKKFIQFKYC